MKRAVEEAGQRYVVYQLGNLFAAINTTLQAGIAAHFHNEFSVGVAVVAACVALIVALLTGFGVEAKGRASRPVAARSSINQRNSNPVNGPRSRRELRVWPGA
jgi:hypothetical protein